ncbi:MAG: AAA family ATPase [bacterium]|nr:AAA family ATPase [bacterium]
MIEKLHIDGFRGHDDVDLDPLGRVNLIVGPGNSGKTNLLEAIFLFCSNGDPRLLDTVLGLRRIPLQDNTQPVVMALLEWFWSVRRDSHSCEIQGIWSGVERRNRIWRVPQEEEVIHVREGSGGTESVAPSNDHQPTLATYQVDTVSNGMTFSGQLRIEGSGIKVTKAGVPNIPGRFMSVLEQGRSGKLSPVWNSVEERGEVQQVTELLRSLDQDIVDVRVGADELERASVRIIHKHLGRTPVEILGSGLGKALSIACYTVAAEKGILIIDEFDASLHVGAQDRIIEFTLEAAKRHDVQLFVSTHSLETIDAFLDCYTDASDLWSGPEDLRVLQLRRTGGRTTVTNLDAEKAKRLREEIGADLRRTT